MIFTTESATELFTPIPITFMFDYMSIEEENRIKVRKIKKRKIEGEKRRER